MTLVWGDFVDNKEQNLKIMKELEESMPGVIASIGYGSGMYPQKGYTKKDNPEKDVIVIVDDLNRFICEDYKVNPHHISKSIYDKFSKKKNKPRWFYHKLGCLKFSQDGYRFKLLIVQKDALLYDIATWKHFGLSARLSKPILYGDIPSDIEQAIEYNRFSVLITALLSTPQHMLPLEELYKTISNLSYIGDLRMLLHFEKANKAANIVDGAYEEFDKIYGSNSLIIPFDDMIFNNHPINHINSLPANLRDYLLKKIDLYKFNKNDPEQLVKIKKLIIDYFTDVNIKNTPLVMYSCQRTLGIKAAAKHAIMKKVRAK